MTPSWKACARVGICVFLLFLAIFYWPSVSALIPAFFGAASPLLIGCAVAYVANLMMSALERIWFPRTSNRFLQKTRRPACLIISALAVSLIVVLVVALILINLEEKGEKKITAKWVLYVVLAFVGNGMCSTVQKVQQLNQAGLYKNEFMIVALVISAIAMGIFALCTEKKKVLPHLKAGFLLYTANGLANGITNFLVIFLSLRTPASVMFPVISAGGIVLTFFISLFFYKEKLSKWQILGSALGLVSVIFLNL
jgi:multidrug transporter EmrE-like cation transporter